MKTIVVIFSLLMLICIAGMVYYSQDDRIFGLFSTGSICVTLFGTYLIDRHQKKKLKDN